MYDDAIKVKVRLDDGAYPPLRAHSIDGGLDLRSNEWATVPSGGYEVVSTGTHVDIPVGYAGLIVSKSGLNRDHGITATGLIDSGFTGEIKVMLHNDGPIERTVHAGDKVAQIMFVKIPKVTMVLDECNEDGVRGDDGYGSSGR